MTRKIFLCLIIGLSAFVVYGAVVEVQSFSSVPTIAGTVESGTIAVDVGPEVPAGVSGYRLLLNRESSRDVVYGVEFDATEVRPRISGLWQSKTNDEGDREDINYIRKSNYLLVPPELPLIWHHQGTPDDTSDDDAVDTLYSLSSIEVSDGGSGYTEPPAVTISGSGGPSLTATAVLAEASARVVDGDLRRAAGKSEDSQGQITDVVLQGAGCYDLYISDPYSYQTPLTVGFSDPPVGGVRAEGVVRFLPSAGGAGPVDRVHLFNEENEQYPRGTGYTVAPTIEIYDEGSGWNAVATAVVSSDGNIEEDATIEAGGHCYASVRDRDLGDVVADHPSYIPKARLVGGDGIGAAVRLVDVNASVAASILGVTITNPGSGYVDPPTVTFSVGEWGLEVPGGVAGKHATAMAIVDGNYPTTETDPGPEPDPPDPEPDPVPTEGRVTHVELVSPGCYDIASDAPTLTFSEPQMLGGVRAEATITFANGAGPITEVYINPRGSGYTTAPVIQLYNEGVGYAAQARARAKKNGELQRRTRLYDNNSFNNGSTGDCYADYDKFGYSDYRDFTDESSTFLP